MPGRELDGLPVALAVLGPQSSAFVAAALERSGATVRAMSSLGGIRAHARTPRAGATVVLNPPPISGAVRAGLRLHSRHGAVVVASVTTTTRERIDLLNGGADYVVTSVDPDEVVAALAAVVRQGRLLCPTPQAPVLHAADVTVDRLERTATAAGRTLALTPLEFDLLAYLVAHAGQAVSRDQLLKDVWGYDVGGRTTVTVHVRRLRRKLEPDPARPTRLQTVWGIGYRLSTVGVDWSPSRGALSEGTGCLYQQD